MKKKDYLNDQKQIFRDLLEGTEKGRGEIVVGAHLTVFSFRASTAGVPAGVIARAVLPEVDGSLPKAVISDSYPFEALMKADVFELRSFHNNECTLLKYENGKRQELHIYPDKAPDCMLVRLEWLSEEGASTVLTEQNVINELKRLSWETAVWFNGRRVKY